MLKLLNEYILRNLWSHTNTVGIGEVCVYTTREHMQLSAEHLQVARLKRLTPNDVELVPAREGDPPWSRSSPWQSPHTVIPFANSMSINTKCKYEYLLPTTNACYQHESQRRRLLDGQIPQRLVVVPHREHSTALWWYKTETTTVAVAGHSQQTQAWTDIHNIVHNLLT